MNQAGKALKELYLIDETARGDSVLHRRHPLLKLVITVVYLLFVIATNKYDIARLLYLAIYPVILFTAGNLSFRKALSRLRVILPLVCLIGVANPFFDRKVAFMIGTLPVTGGVLSMVTLAGKAVLCVLASYILIAVTPIGDICYALRLLHVPQILVIEILLIYRYAGLFLREVKRISQAYALRAPGQKGIHMRAWGPLVGRLLLRSLTLAQEVFGSMQLRGFHGEFYYEQKRD